MTLDRQLWAVHHGHHVYLYMLENSSVKLVLSNYGALIKEIIVKNGGQEKSIVLSYETFEEYVLDEFYLGTVVGRCANRIDGGIMKVDDQSFQLSINEPSRNNHLHGGFEGFNKKVFDVVNVQCSSEQALVTFRYTSAHLEEGYPGKCELNVTFILEATGQFRIRYQASCDRDTHVNVTHHTYFNLHGAAKSRVTDHQLLVKASKRLAMNERFLPTGEIIEVRETPFDLRNFTTIGEAMHQVNGGFNMYYLFDESGDQHPQVELRDEETKTALTLSTSLPGMILYTGDYLREPFMPNAGICLETQLPPDACNHPTFPSTLLRKGNKFDHYTSFQFNWSQ